MNYDNMTKLEFKANTEFRCIVRENGTKVYILVDTFKQKILITIPEKQLFIEAVQIEASVKKCQAYELEHLSKEYSKQEGTTEDLWEKHFESNKERNIDNEGLESIRFDAAINIFYECREGQAVIDRCSEQIEKLEAKIALKRKRLEELTVKVEITDFPTKEGILYVDEMTVGTDPNKCPKCGGQMQRWKNGTSACENEDCNFVEKD